MADSFFGFDTSASNLNDDDGGGGDGSEDEYDALNDETFGQADEYDWEVAHEQVAHQIESSRRQHTSMDDEHSQLEASLSQLVLDEIDSSHNSSTFGASNVWQHDLSLPAQPAPTSGLKNVCTVEELERQLRMNQQQQPPQMQQNYYQPRFPPVILQRPPGLQAPVPLPFAPQHNMGQNMGQNMPQNSGQNVGQIGNQLQNNQLGPMGNQLGQMGNQMMSNQSQKMNQFMQNQFPSMGHPPQQNQMMPNQMGPNQLPPNQMGPNQMVPNGNQFGQNQFQHMMGQPRMMPPPGLNMPPRQNFNPNVGQYNQNFRGSTKPMDQPPPMNQPNMMMKQQQQHPLQHQQQQTTQSPRQTSPLMPNQKSPAQQKMQKQRVIYNSNQKNQNVPWKNLDSFGLFHATKNMIESENLTQYLQGMLPMRQMNNSFHNASHHPMLNNRNVQPGFNSNQMLNHPMFNNQRVNGSFSNNNRGLMNGDEEHTNGGTDGDEYAGLMTQREKQWLINIQMLQLNTGTPYLDDFYYTVFLERQSRKEKEGVKEAHKANQQNHPFYSGGVKETHSRERHNSQRHNSQSEDVQPRTYVPTQFENSLGKLQCGSVTAPRKIIDVELVQSETAAPGSQRPSRAPSVASTTNPHEMPREVRRTKQLLLDIESLYLILLRLEELNEPLAISNALILKEREEKQKLLEAAAVEGNVFLRNIESVQRRRTDSPKPELTDKRQVVNLIQNSNPPPAMKNLLDENKDELINRLFLALLHEDRVQQFLLVRKGKTFLARLLARTSASHSRLRALWARVMRALPAAARRDDGSLNGLAQPYRLYIENSNGWSAVLESCAILTEAFDPARTPYALTSSFTLSSVCVLLEKATTLVNTPEATANERQWTKFLKTFARALKNTTLNVAKPLKPLSESKLSFHLKQIESRTTIEILQRGKTTAEFADLSKSELAELLLRYLS